MDSQWSSWLFLGLLLSFCCHGYTHASYAKDVTITSKDKSTSVVISGTTGVVVSAGGIPVKGFTNLQDCDAVPNSVQVRTENINGTTAAIVYQNVKCGANTITVEDTFSPGAESVIWHTNLGIFEVNHEPFTTPIFTEMQWIGTHQGGSSSPFKYWTPWGKGCLHNNRKVPGICYSYQGPWAPGFTPESLPAKPALEDTKTKAEVRYRLGEVLLDKDTPYSLGVDDLMTVPLVHVLPNGATPPKIMDSTVDNVEGITVALDVSEYLSDVILHASYNRTSFSRHFLKIDVGVNSVMFTQHIKCHRDNDWRSAMGFMVREFPFVMGEPHNTHIRDLEGLGAYTWWQGPWEDDKEDLDAYGFKTNWELSGMWMPYDGLFLPYQPEWLNLAFEPGLAQYNVTYKRINAFHQQMQSLGYHSLSYFMIGGVGTKINLPPKQLPPYKFCGHVNTSYGEPFEAPCPTPTGSNEYVWSQLMEGALRNCWHPYYGFHNDVIHDWVGTILMDPYGPKWKTLLLDQAQRHLDMLPDFEGIAIDRLDYTDYYNYAFDDGVSWVPYPTKKGEKQLFGPAMSLRVSNNLMFGELHQMYHHRSRKVMMMNCNTMCRVDLLKYFDGTFSEGSVLNAVGWTGMRRPTILWTYNLDNHTADELHHAFQAHLLMKVYPMAPTPKNDHSIQPQNKTVNGFYKMYGKSFNALHGAVWNLQPHSVVVVKGGGAELTVNSLVGPALEVGQAPVLLVPVVFGTPKSTVSLQLRDPPGLNGDEKAEYDCATLSPGGATWVPLPPCGVTGGVGEVSLKLSDVGSALLRCYKAGKM
eukprot:TRINITY_DN93852_c0_g1_i1.p1 TRINITY_DN93852_c0_g1~~TRINITY_DN93852_c0_g1_i1.p1  ORF type:complete len:808 (+),score=70.02 TRINITY_DN93852_c0_g1_i1:44-2467(+)